MTVKDLVANLDRLFGGTPAREEKPVTAAELVVKRARFAFVGTHGVTIFFDDRSSLSVPIGTHDEYEMVR